MVCPPSRDQPIHDDKLGGDPAIVAEQLD